MARTADNTENPTLAQQLALGAAIVFVLVGVAGFFVTGFDGFAHHDTGETLLGFEVNPLHNLVHLALGLPGLALWRTLRGTVAYGVLVAAAYSGALVYGLLAVGKDWDVLSLNVADNLLHLALALTGAAIAALAAYERRATAGRRTTLRRGTGYPRPDAA